MHRDRTTLGNINKDARGFHPSELFVGNKRISQFFDSACQPRSRVIALVDSTWVFLSLSFYMVISRNMPLFKVWSEDKLKFVVAGYVLDVVEH